LVVLAELLRTRSTTATAKRLGRTQSAVSHALARLRAQFDDELFVRAGAALQPTARAAAMIEPLERVLQGARSLVSQSGVAFDPARLERTFVLGGTDMSDVVILPRLVPMLLREAPGVSIWSRAPGDLVERAIQEREVDLVMGTRFRPLAGLVQQRIGELSMVSVLRAGHPSLRAPLDLDAFLALDHVLVTPRNLPGSPVDDALEAMGRTRRVVLRLPHFTAAAFVVAQTDLVISLPRPFAEAMARSTPLAIVPLPLDLPPFAFAVAFHEAYSLDPAHRWFRERFVDVARETLGIAPNPAPR
jgi:DNA-binding transcriptional LysR family regulator